ncbi:acid protease [Serendipita vermifera]|nr:acid protease [Serendipita vermifera]
MRTFLLFLWPAWSTLALHFDITARSISSYKTVVGNVLAAGDEDHSDEVFSTRDVLYIANVTIDGTSYPLQMDTGSSDLWANMGSNQPSNPTELSVNLTYGTGFAYGPVSRGPVTFAGYDIPEQAFLQFKDGANPVFNFGAVGIVGLGFTGLSHIDAAVTSNGNGTWGRSLLYNIFALNPSEPNFIAMALERANDPSDTVQGSLGVGELAPEYADISSTDHIPLFPPEGSNRWTILLDSYVVNGATQNLTSTISDVPQGRAAVLVDSGTTYSYVPPDVAKSIYSTVPGATLDTTTNQWSVPCSGGIRLTLWFAGRAFDIHPLDTVIPSLADETKCMGSFIPSQLAVGANEFDWIIGTNVLRSLYVVYDFGDFDANNVMGNPYIQLLSLVEIDQAASDFSSLRGGTVNVDQGNGNASSSVSVLTTSQKLDKLLDLVPLIFAVIGANALILITLLAIIIWMCCYLKKQNARKPKNPPLPLTTVATSPHAYEAVPTQDNDNRSPSRNLSRTASKQPQSNRSINKEYTDNPNASSTSLVRPSISISKEDDDEAKRASRIVPVGGDASRRSSRLTPPGDSPPPTTRHSRVPSKLSEVGVGTPRHSRIPSNMAPASPTTPTTFITPTGTKGKDDDFADADLMPYDDDGKEGKKSKRDTFQPPPPISTLQGGYRKSTYSEMSASPTVAGSEYHFGKGKERSSYYPPGRQSSGNSENQNLMSPSPTEASFQDARQSYYSNPNASVGGLPLPNVPPVPASAGVPVVVEEFSDIPEEPHTAPARTQQQEAHRAAFMAALDEPLAPPRRPRGLGGLAAGGNESRMSAYSRLSPTQDSFDPAQLNRHSYAAPAPPNAAGMRGFPTQDGAGMQGGPQRSSYAPGSRRGPFMSNPSPFNPNQSPNPSAPNNSSPLSGRGNGMQ